jgi:FtsP/CotA-like multicopper oxidase with cupredoxin domain
MFSIDEHPLWVYAIDGRYVRPTVADAFAIGNGQRYSVMVKLKEQPLSKYNIRAVSDDATQIINGSAFLSYAGVYINNSSEASSEPYITLAGLNATADTTFLNESLAIPFPPVAPAETVDATYILTVGHANGSYLWRMSNDSFPYSLDREAPLLFNPNELAKHNLSDLTIRNKNGSWVDLIVTPQGLDQVAHTLHKHTNKFYVIGSGRGTWNYSSVAEAMEVMPGSFNLVNPPIRDSYPTLAVFDGMDTWTVYRYQVVNPGAWLFHCHIQTHLDGGMAVALIDGYDVWPDVPEEYTSNSGFPVGESCNASVV